MDFPLSAEQARIWFLQQLMPDLDAYRVPIVLRLRGRLDITALHQALRTITSRHEVLRTTFPATDGQPVQRVSSAARIEMPVMDAGDRPLAEIVADKAGPALDLATGPLFHALLVRLCSGDHVLILTAHHIVFDGSSARVFYSELAALYLAHHAGRPDPLPPLAIQYGDYAAWQHEQADTPHGREQIAWWVEQLNGAPPVTNLPGAKRRPPVQRYAGAAITRHIPAEHWQSLLGLAARCRVTPFMVLLACYAMLLADPDRQPEVVVGVPVTQRGRPELDPLIGIFANLLPLRINVDSAGSFADLLAVVRRVTLDAFAHREVPFETLVQRLRLPRATSHNPLVQVVLAPDPEPAVPMDFGDLSVEEISLLSETVKFDLVLAVAPTTSGSGQELTVAYRTDLFDEPVARRVADSYLRLIELSINAPETGVFALVARTPAISEEVSPGPIANEARPAEVHRGPGNIRARRQLTAIWEEILELDHVAPDDNFFDLGGNSLLLVRVHSRLVATLQRSIPLLGLYQYPTIAALARYFEEQPELAAGQDAAQFAGQAGRLRLRRRREQLTRSAAGLPALPEAVAVHRAFEWQAAVRPDDVAVSDEEITLAYGELNERANRLARYLATLGVRPETRVGILLERSVGFVVAALAILKAGAAYVPIDPAYPQARLAALSERIAAPVVLTASRFGRMLPLDSGTPVYLDRMRADLESLSSDNLDIPVGEDNLAYVMFTSGSTGEPKGVLVTHRGVVRLVREAAYVRLGPDEVMLHLSPVSFDASTFEIWGALLNGGRLVVGPPSLAALADVGRLVRDAGITVSLLTTGLFHLMADEHPGGLAGVRQLLVGGDVLSARQVARVVAGAPGCQVINAYGPAETTTLVTTHPVPADITPDDSVAIGRPADHAIVRILDEYLQLTPIGVPGQLYAGGHGLARGYLDDPARTAAAFVPDPFATLPGARLYATGDRARYLADATIEYLGRLDQQVKIRGFRVEPAEIETQLRRHPRIRDVAVVPHGDTAESRRLVAYVTGVPDVQEVRAWLRERLPNHLVPDFWMPIDAMPLTWHGKIDRDRLPPPVPVTGRRRLASAEHIERVVSAVWAEVLGLPMVGRDDDFFDLGGYSILAMRVLQRLRQILKAELNLSALFDYPTVAELANFISESASQEDGQKPNRGD